MCRLHFANMILDDSLPRATSLMQAFIHGLRTLLGQPFLSLAHLLVPPYLLSTSQPSYLTKVSCAESSPRGNNNLMCSVAGPQCPACGQTLQGVSIRTLMRLAPEQSRETFLGQKDTADLNHIPVSSWELHFPLQSLGLPSSMLTGASTFKSVVHRSAR